MSLTFYLAPMSTAGITELVLAELGIPCERVHLDISKGDTQKPEYLKLNPNGKVPTIVHDGTVIWESAAITIYLGETFGTEKKLYPAPGLKRGEAMKWIVWTNVTLGDAVGRFTKAVEAAKKDVGDCLRILDESLRGKQFLLGEYTLADTHVNAFVDWLRHMKMDLTPYPQLQAWGQRCCARPAYLKVMASRK